ncbi:cell surface protein SprA [Longibacter salinarum]|uniref:Cell surface protein SprA n=2 Tax=Longibacter salinarum TaxID=1850348 RepID=A0A2A8CX84_9BACT|nr:cell surface protein SprA [Longibacter salinarum]
MLWPEAPEAEGSPAPAWFGGISEALTSRPAPYIRPAVSDTDSVAVPADTVDIDTTAVPPQRPDTARTRTTRRPDLLTPDQSVQDLSVELADTARTLDSATVAHADTGLVDKYLRPRRDRRGIRFGESSPLLGPKTYRAGETELDSMRNEYIVRPTTDTSAILRVDSETYRQQRFASNATESWRQIAKQRQGQRRQRGGLGVNIVVPGGRESPFSTIFGKPQVDLRVNGQADINAGFDYRKSDRQVSITGDASQIDPSFKQDLRLGVTGTIGDKMQIDIDWDTNNQFDYQNQVKLKYTGYEDEIVQSIEAGNVFLETPSNLIRGGTSQFGIKSRFQLGNFSLTTIASQQEGQSSRETISGGSETSEFAIRPTEYDDNTHFFLSYFFRNSWNEVLSSPNNIQLLNGFQEITEIEVWRLDIDPSTDEPDTRKAVAVVDLGESPRLITETDDYNDLVLPSGAVDQYPQSELDILRANEPGTSVSDYLKTQVSQPLNDEDFQTGTFVRLEENRDYTFDPNLGYLSLNQRLQEQEALAIAFKYRASNGQVQQVGDFSSDGGGAAGGQNDRQLVLKLLRPSSMPAPTASALVPAWYLQMRNVYRLGGRGFTPDNFNLDITYSPPGQSGTPTLREIDNSPLLRVLGLDRINVDGASTPDNQFDFIPGITIDPGEGLLFFPYIEPFGTRLEEVAQENGSLSEAEPFIFSELYDNKRENAARNNSDKDAYAIEGEYRGSSQEFFDLQAFTGIVEGSVEVTSGGTKLQEGVDYVVDYQGGTVTITDQSYLAEGRDIEISYEKNSFTNLQQKTLLGARADYALRDQVAIGATLMRLSEKSPVDKYRIGEEPIQNTIWGVDGSLDLEPGWLTRAVDAMPLIQTRGESSIQLSGEFAQLRPGHTETEAYRRTQDRLSGAGLGFRPDEQDGISYIDDFEGFENTFSLAQNPQGWSLSAPPAEGVTPLGTATGSKTDSLVTNRRALFGWYQLNQNTLEDVAGKSSVRGEESAFRLVDVRNVFPNRDLTNDVDPTLRTLDLYFNPFERGPYNYTTELGSFVGTPEENWGGFTQRLPEGYNDFSLQNVEFIEFIFKPYPEGGDAGANAKLYLNLGNISEDVIPNDRLNSEDGLSSSFNEEDLDDWGRTPSGQTNEAIDISGNRTEDLGLDGLASYDESAYADELLERNQFSDFYQSLDNVDRTGLTSEQQSYLDAEIARARLDPSGDDYQYFENDVFFQDPELYPRSLYPEGATVQQRFSRYFSNGELNGFEAQNRLARNVSVRRGVSQTPEDEDLNFNQTIDVVNEYYEYEIPLSEQVLDQQADETATNDFVVSEIRDDETGQGTGWYKVRIPVRLADDPPADRNDVREVGDIDGFNLIESIRMWTSGHSQPITIRFATLELVGSQWREAEEIPTEDQTDPDDGSPVVEEGNAEVRVASVNDEEDANYESPLGAILSRTRSARGTQARSREQALVLSVDDLGGQTLGKQEQRGVVKSVQALNLLKYRRVRMYTHLHGTISSMAPALQSEDGPDNDVLDENLRLFVRFGTNQSDSYYEYEQELIADDIPGPETSAQQLWREENSVNLVLSALNRLKVARDQAATPPTEVFSRRADALSDEYGDRPENLIPTLKIRGTPALSGITTIVIGVRHMGNTTDEIENVELWTNELRVTGYDERPGWAVTSNATVQLADVAEVSGSFENRTDGFGSLSSTLNERQQSDRQIWNVRSSFNVDKLLPERQGWQIPVTVEAGEERQTPRFDPIRNDVRVEEIVDQIESDPSLSADERERQIEEVRNRAETLRKDRSMTASVQKQGSESWLLRNTMDALSLSGSYSTQTARSPEQLVNDQWSWNSDATYQLTFGQPRTVSPFWFLDDVPVLGRLGDLQFNYVPQSTRFSASASRTFQSIRNRDQRTNIPDDAVKGRAQNPFRDTQTFNHSRTFNLQYNPFQFLNLTFGTNTRETLNRAGATERINLYDRDGRLIATTDDLDRFLAESPQYDQGSIGDSVFVENRLDMKSEGDILSDLLSGRSSGRTGQYAQNFTATLRPSLLEGETFNWIDLRDITYSSTFNWRNAPEGSPVGATASNSATLNTGISLQPNRVWERFGFFRSMKEAQEKARREKEAERREREREKEERREGETDDGAEDTAETAPDAQETPEEEAREESQEPQGDEGGDESGEDSGEDRPEQRSWSDLPLPDPVGVLRRVALTFMDIRDVRFTYQNTRSVQTTGVGNEQEILPPGSPREPALPQVDYSLYDAFLGRGPSFGYRFGFSRDIGISQRVLGTDRQVVDALTNQNDVGASTTLSPSQALQVDLDWSLKWSNSPKTTYTRFDPDSVPGTQRPENFRTREDGVSYTFFRNESGSGSASVWTFGSYDSFFDSQKELLEANVSNPTSGADPSGVALTNTSATNSFRDAYLVGGGTAAGNGFVPFPLPGWNVRYTGIADWPLLRSITQSATLRHGYSGTYTTAYNALSTAGDTTNFGIAGSTLSFQQPDFESSRVEIEETYRPLLGVDVTWLGGFQTTIDWNRQNRVSLSTTNLSVEESAASELSLTATWRKRGLKLPLLPVGRLNNQITFSLTVKRAVTDQRTFSLRRALSEAAAQGFAYGSADARTGDNVSISEQTTLLTIEPQLQYQFSQRVNGQFQLTYERLDGDSRRPSYTNIAGSFNVRINISEN